jgi:hypothetical protein
MTTRAPPESSWTSPASCTSSCARWIARSRFGVDKSVLDNSSPRDAHTLTEQKLVRAAHAILDRARARARAAGDDSPDSCISCPNCKCPCTHPCNRKCHEGNISTWCVYCSSKHDNPMPTHLHTDSNLCTRHMRKIIWESRHFDDDLKRYRDKSYDGW